MEGRDFVLVLKHVSIRLVFVNLKVQTELFKDLNGALHVKAIQHLSHFTLATSKDLEFSALNEIGEVRELSNELFKQDAASFDKLSILVVLHLHVANVN